MFEGNVDIHVGGCARVVRRIVEIKIKGEGFQNPNMTATAYACTRSESI